MLLFADSEPLFRAEGRSAVVAALARRSPPRAANAAYVGASNGDDPAFVELARAAVAGLGVPTLRAVPAAPNDDDRAFLADADLVFLSGGDARVGLERMLSRGLVAPIRESARRGATVLGVSAGAVQMGLSLLDDPMTGALGLVPYVVSAHDEPSWASLMAAIRARAGAVCGLGVSWRSAVAVGDAGAAVPVRGETLRVWLENGQLRRAVLAA